MKKKRHVLSKSDNREPLHLNEELVDLLYDYSMCGLAARSSASHTTHARHANNAAAGHDLLVEPRHHRHGDALQLLLPGLIFLCFGTQIVLEPSSSLLMMVVLILAWH
jgi:hypothetical protein